MRVRRLALFAAGFGAVATLSNCVADSTTQPAFVMPDATPAGKPHFDSRGVQVGEQIPDLPMFDEHGDSTNLAGAISGRPTLLVTSSYTCPFSRRRYPDAAELIKKLKGRVNLAIVYVIEAHPSGDPSPYSGTEEVTNENRIDHVRCRQPRTLQERLALANKFRAALHVDAPMFVDGMDNLAWKSLGGGPNMGMLVDEQGIVLARQGWFDAASMEKAADVLVAVMPTTTPSGAARRDANINGNDLEEVQAVWAGLAAVQDEVGRNPSLVKKVYPYQPRGNEGDRTLLHYAIGNENPESQHVDIVKFLVEHGADVNKQTEHAASPLHLAAANGNVAIARILLAHGAKVNVSTLDHGPTPLDEALIHGHADVAKLLVDAGAGSNFYSDIAMGKVAEVRAALAKDASIANRPDGWWRTPLAYAAGANRLEMAKVLLDAGARDLPRKPWRFDGDPGCAVEWAVRAKHAEMVKLLCDHGSDANLLDVAISVQSLEIARELIAHHADVNQDDIRGFKPLHQVAIDDNVEMAELLLKSGANPNAPTGQNHEPCGPGTIDKTTPLHIAAESGAKRVLAVLIKGGATVDLADTTGQTPLHYAVDSTQSPAVQIAIIGQLLDAKANINAKDQEGRTPLDSASRSAQGEKRDTTVVDYLRAHGAKAGGN